ncbi:MAG: DNA processing protein [Verrucomicrobiales bacterium]
MTTEEAFIILNLLPQVGAARVRKLLENFGEPQAILAASIDQIRRVNGFGSELARTIHSWEETIDLQRELRRIQEIGATLVTWASDDYPEMLREIPSPPLVLYVRGTLDPRDRHAVAIVGSRRATSYGLTCAKKLGFQLAHANVTVISGLARGIDTAAHESALAAKGRTIAVIGSGLGKLYPPENEALAERIANGGGAVVSEFPVDYPPDKQSFPLRNRIVAGWGQGVLVVEAPKRSGALITAGQALDYGRNVYAVPGPIDRPTSQGANNLIKNGARLVMDVGDVLDDMEMLFPEMRDARTATPKPAESAQLAQLTEEERAIYALLETSETQMDDIIAATGLPIAIVSSSLLRLEMKRLVKQLPGSHFVKLV